MHNTNENDKNILKLNRKCKNGVHRKVSSARTVQFQQKNTIILAVDDMRGKYHKLMEFDINSGQSFVVFKATSYIRSEINTY